MRECRREWMNTMEVGMVLVNWFAAVPSAFWKFAGNHGLSSVQLKPPTRQHYTFFNVFKYTSNIRVSYKKDNSF